jgi:hypothetical protein
LPLPHYISSLALQRRTARPLRRPTAGKSSDEKGISGSALSLNDKAARKGRFVFLPTGSDHRNSA